jgi:hypothetical protein
VVATADRPRSTAHDPCRIDLGEPIPMDEFDDLLVYGMEGLECTLEFLESRVLGRLLVRCRGELGPQPLSEGVSSRSGAAVRGQ